MPKPQVVHGSTVFAYFLFLKLEGKLYQSRDFVLSLAESPAPQRSLGT